MPKTLHETFKAWIDKQPGAGNPIHVTGMVEVPTGGWKGELLRATPDGINPQILLLDLTLTKPTGPATEVISKISVRYDETPARVEYTNVQIRADDGDFTIPVDTTQ